VSKLRLLKRLASVAAVAGSIVFLVLALRSSWGNIAKLVSDTHVLLLATGLSLVYGLAILFCSVPGSIPCGRTHRCVSGCAGAYVYAVSNIAKYLPGNIFHAGRQIRRAPRVEPLRASRVRPYSRSWRW
jgi:hypothetical protein